MDLPAADHRVGLLSRTGEICRRFFGAVTEPKLAGPLGCQPHNLKAAFQHAPVVQQLVIKASLLPRLYEMAAMVIIVRCIKTVPMRCNCKIYLTWVTSCLGTGLSHLACGMTAMFLQGMQHWLRLSPCGVQGVANRDLKLENLLVVKREGEGARPLLKICDFGFSKVGSGSTALLLALPTSCTAAGHSAGMSQRKREGVSLLLKAFVSGSVKGKLAASYTFVPCLCPAASHDTACSAGLHTLQQPTRGTAPLGDAPA